MIAGIENSFTSNVLMLGCPLQVTSTWVNSSMATISPQASCVAGRVWFKTH